MTATNINLDQLLHVLSVIRKSGIRMIDLDMLPDENHANMNKIVIHPVKTAEDVPMQTNYQNQNRMDDEIRNPQIATDTDDIFNLFNDVL